MRYSLGRWKTSEADSVPGACEMAGGSADRHVHSGGAGDDPHHVADP